MVNHNDAHPDQNSQFTPQRRTVRRHPAYIYRRRRIAALGIVTLLLLLVVFLAGACGPGPTQSLQGDQLGPEPEESAQDYQQRAAQTLEDARKDTYALVTFNPAVDIDTAAAAVDSAKRVSALITQEEFVPVEIPEPIDGESRSDVFAREVGNAKLNSVIVYDSGEALSDIAQGDDVFALEAAPNDAAWGSFAIRPLMANEDGDD